MKPGRPTPMDRALAAAREAAAAGDVPVGAVLLGPDGQLLAVAGNAVERLCDPTAHAEILVLREGARRLGTPRLFGCDLYVTLEPCPMCAGAIALARIRRLYFGAEDPKAGAVVNGARLFDLPTCHHRPEVYGGIGERASADLLKAFFQQRRD
ncbi:tRNA-specific adenosine deaminase [bacterium HR40]|nr:tRNA-specific adenosine deaminase [bacterium HR40]